MMPSVDCWRLLGLRPDATAEEVRAAYLRRVRDAHPDAGGTGDGLTMALLQEAQDEAVALVEARGRGQRKAGAPATASESEPSRRGRSKGPTQPKVRSHPCYVCQRQFPRPQLVKSRIYRGFRGRASGGHVLMCLTCQVEIEAEYTKATNTQVVITVFALIAMLVFAFVMTAAKS